MFHPLFQVEDVDLSGKESRLVLREGSAASSPVLASHPDITSVIMSAGPQMLVQYSSGPSPAGRGFNVSYKAGKLPLFHL